MFAFHRDIARTKLLIKMADFSREMRRCQLFGKRQKSLSATVSDLDVI
jgi:hypothetical protein